MALVILGFMPLAAALAVPAALAWGAAARGEAGGARGRGGRLPAASAWLAASLAAAVAASLGASEAGAASPVGAGLRAGALVGAFGAFAAALAAAARSAGASPAAGQCAAAGAAALLAATPFYMNPLIERADPAARSAWVAFTAGANPVLVLLHDAAGVDPLRAPLLYDLSVCQYYAYAYPSAWTLAAVYGAAALGLAAAAAGIRRLRAARTAEGG
jgi:hypothetical protein